MAIVDARADVHMQANQRHAAAIDPLQARGELIEPDAVLARRTAGVGLGAVPMGEAGIDAQPDRVSRAGFADLPDHLRRTKVHRNAECGDASERLPIHKVGGEDDLGLVGGGRVPGRKCALDLAQGNGIDDDDVAPHHPQDTQVAVRLLGISNDVEGAKLLDLALDQVVGYRDGMMRHRCRYMIWFTTPPSTRMAAPDVPEAASLQR